MRERLPMSRFWLLGIATLMAGVLLRLLFMKDGYFWQDDFSYLYEVRNGISLPVLFQDYNGHLMPGTFLLSWIVSASGASWTVAVWLLVVLQVAAGLSLLWVVGLLFRGHPGSLVVYALAIFTPLTLVGSMWFAYGLQLWPQQIASTLALGCLVKYRESGSWRWAAGVLGAFVGGLFFWEKAALILPVLLVFSVLIVDRGQTWRQRWRGLRTQWRLWLPMLAVAAAYTVLYLVLTSTQNPDRSGLSPVEVANNALLRTLLPGLLGGPWTNRGSLFTVSAMPNDIVTALVALIWIAIIGASWLWRGRSAPLAWAWALLAICGNYALTLLFRPEAATLVRDTRYIADVVPVLALAIGLAFLPRRFRVPAPDGAAEVTTPAAPETSDPPEASSSSSSLLAGIPLKVTTAVALFVSACLFASAWVSTSALAPELKHLGSRLYVDSLRRAAAADPDRPILDRRSPFPAVYFRPQSMLAEGLGLRLNWVEQGRDVSMFDDSGRLVPVTVPSPGYRKAGPSQGCGWLVRPGSPARIDLGNQVAGFDKVLNVGVLSGGDRPLRLVFDNGHTVVTSTGPDRLAVITVNLDFPAKQVTVSAPESRSVVCIADVTVGGPQAPTTKP